MSAKESQNSKTSRNSSKEKSNPSISINYLWPIYGRESKMEKLGSFWHKDVTTLPSAKYDKLHFSGVLSRVGKKKKIVKNYFYQLFGSYLCYFKKPTDKTIKGYVKLNLNIKLDKKNFVGKKDDFYFIELNKNGSIRKLYSKDKNLVD